MSSWARAAIAATVAVMPGGFVALAVVAAVSAAKKRREALGKPPEPLALPDR